jgi:hypothetical protein
MRKTGQVTPTEEDFADIAKLGQAAVPSLAAYFALGKKQNGFEQLLAVKFLASIRTPSIIAPLGAALNTGDWQVARLSALETLGSMPGSEATALIPSALGDADPQVSERAKDLLGLRQSDGRNR